MAGSFFHRTAKKRKMNEEQQHQPEAMQVEEDSKQEEPPAKALEAESQQDEEKEVEPTFEKTVEAEPEQHEEKEVEPTLDNAVEAEPEENGVEPASSSKGPGATRVKRFTSPDDILVPISPPGCYIGLSTADHRWTSRFPVGEEQGFDKLTGKFKQVNFSRTFVTKYTWQQALVLVHAHCWQKWKLVKEHFPLGSKTEEEPGSIQQATFVALKPKVDELPPVIRYYDKSS